MLLSNLLCQILFLLEENLASVTYCACQIRYHNVLDMGLCFTSIWKLQPIQDLPDYLLSSIFSSGVLKQPWTTCTVHLLVPGLIFKFGDLGLLLFYLSPLNPTWVSNSGEKHIGPLANKWWRLRVTTLPLKESKQCIPGALVSRGFCEVLLSCFLVGPNKSQILTIACVSRNPE